MSILCHEMDQAHSTALEVARIHEVNTMTENNVNYHHIRTAKPVTLGNMLSDGTSTLSIDICPVMLARSENFPSITGVVKPSMPRSRIKPRIRLSTSSALAHTMNTSAIGEFVILSSTR